MSEAQAFSNIAPKELGQLSLGSDNQRTNESQKQCTAISLFFENLIDDKEEKLITGLKTILKDNKPDETNAIIAKKVLDILRNKPGCVPPKVETLLLTEHTSTGGRGRKRTKKNLSRKASRRKSRKASRRKSRKAPRRKHKISRRRKK